MDRAEGLVREMEEQGIDAPIDVYHTMMDGYTMIGDEEKCLIVFERLKVLPPIWASIKKYAYISILYVDVCLSFILISTIICYTDLVS